MYYVAKLVLAESKIFIRSSMLYVLSSWCLALGPHLLLALYVGREYGHCRLRS